MSDKAGKLVFACGATMEVNDVMTSPIGKRLVVDTFPDQKHSRPIGTDGKELHCVWLCPSTIKLSGRKLTHCFFAGGQRGQVMACKVTDHIVDANKMVAP